MRLTMRETFLAFRRSPLLSALSILTIAFSLFAFGLFGLVALNVHQAHHMFDQIEFHEKECLPFYDHYLKGVDNWVMDEAPVRIFVRNTGKFREEPEWPLPRAQ